MINYSIPGLSKLRKAVQLSEGEMASRNAVAITESLALLQPAIEARVKTGPGHFGFHARDQIFTQVAGGRKIVGSLFTIAPQLRWSEEGTREHQIKQWRDTGRGFSIQVVIHHPGQKPTHLFRRTLAAMKGAIKGIFVDTTKEIVSALSRSSQ